MAASSLKNFSVESILGHNRQKRIEDSIKSNDNIGVYLDQALPLNSNFHSTLKPTLLNINVTSNLGLLIDNWDVERISRSSFKTYETIIASSSGCGRVSTYHN